MVLCACNDEKRFASEFTRENAGCQRIVATLRHPVEPLAAFRKVVGVPGVALGSAPFERTRQKKEHPEVLSIVEVMSNS
ncbi:hypothetical protein [Aquabacterium sp.]|uniref:hypothetical protein n=1 Tax=Aquabacterium sp. TaxID=1872578 RepID=UPI0035ADD2D4